MKKVSNKEELRALNLSIIISESEFANCMPGSKEYKKAGRELWDYLNHRRILVKGGDVESE